MIAQPERLASIIHQQEVLAGNVYALHSIACAVLQQEELLAQQQQCIGAAAFEVFWLKNGCIEQERLASIICQSTMVQLLLMSPEL